MPRGRRIVVVRHPKARNQRLKARARISRLRGTYVVDADALTVDIAAVELSVGCTNSQVMR
jgi:hypothetical protein